MRDGFTERNFSKRGPLPKSLIAIITGDEFRGKLLPFENDPSFSIVSFETFQGRSRYLPLGLRHKLAFRYALESGFSRVFPVYLDEAFEPEFLLKLLGAYDDASLPEAVYGYRAVGWGLKEPKLVFHKFWGSWFITQFQNWILSVQMSEFLSRYHSYSTDLLSRIPFERNSDGEHFTTELAVQCLAAQARILQVPLVTAKAQGKRTMGALGYLWGAAKLILHLRLMRMGFLYDRRFDLGTWEYPAKSSAWSSHSQIEKRVAAGAKVLDIGCGKGLIAQRLIDKGCVVSGVDILEPGETSSKLHQYLSVDLNREPERFFAWFREQRFDVIVMGDIIEHLVDPESFLEALRNSLSSDHEPTLIISTGNVAFFIVRLMLLIGQFNYAPRGILDRTHTRLFTQKSFDRIFQQCGYEVLSKGWTSLPLSSLGGGLWRLGERISFQLAEWFPGAFAYQMIYQVRPLPTTYQMLGAPLKNPNRPTNHLSKNITVFSRSEPFPLDRT